jgi:hypothetical protein
MGHIDMGQPHCGTGEAAVAAGSNSRDTGSCIHKVLDHPAGMAGSDYTASCGQYPAASPAGPPADDDRSSCRPGSVLQTNRVLSRLGNREALQCKIRGGVAVAGYGIAQAAISTSRVAVDGWQGDVSGDDKAEVVVK